MTPTNTNSCILAIAPSARGFGFAMFDGEQLVDWGVKQVNSHKNSDALRKLERLILRYTPAVMVFEDSSAKDSQRRARIRKLGPQMISMAKNHSVKVRLLTRQQVRKVFFTDGKGTKDALAEIIANRFPEDLGFRLPRKRRAWMNEAYQMGIFDAVAMAVAACSQ